MLGDDYIAQHFWQTLRQEARDYQYRRYVTEALYAISRGNQAMQAHWSDMDPGFQPVHRKQTEAEIRADLLAAVNEGRTG